MTNKTKDVKDIIVRRIVYAIISFLVIFVVYENTHVEILQPKNLVNIVPARNEDTRYPIAEYYFHDVERVGIITGLPKIGLEEKMDRSQRYQDYFGHDTSTGFASVSPKIGFETKIDAYPSLTWKTQTIYEANYPIRVDIEYPQFIGGHVVVLLNQYISDIIQKRISIDKEKIKEMLAMQPDCPFDSSTGATCKFALYVKYRVWGVVNGIVNLEMVMEDGADGAMGIRYEPIVINWDLRSNRLLAIDDIFCFKEHKQILPSIIAKKIKSLSSVDKEFVDWWLNDKDNMDIPKFLLRNNGVIAIFPPYVVGAGGAGIIREFIPKEDLTGLLCQAGNI